MAASFLRIVHTEASAGWGGQEIRILSEAAGLRERGHEVTLLCPGHTRLYQEARAQGQPVVDLPIGKKKLPGLLALRRWLRQNPVDVINSHSSTDTWLSALACLGLPRAPALVRTRHISAPIGGNGPSRWLYSRASRHVVTTGESIREHLIEVVGVPAAQVSSIPTGIDTQRYRPGDRLAARQRLGLAADKRYLGIVATLRSWKGHSHLLEAFAQLPDPQLELLIVGDGPQRQNLEQQARELGLGERVRFAGDQADVVPWLQSLDVFALPSWANEGVPQALLQALSCALPAVGTPIGGIPELIEHERTGLLVPPQTPAALAAAIRRLLAEPETAQAWGQAGRARVEAKHGRERMLDRMEAVFRAALQR